MPNRLRQWWALPVADRALVPAMMIALSGISLGLRCFGYVRVHAWVDRATLRTTKRQATRADILNSMHLARLAAIAGRHTPVEATCLRQALLIHGLLRWKRLNPELKLGVRRQGDTLSAHAWVELEGESLDHVVGVTLT